MDLSSFFLEILWIISSMVFSKQMGGVIFILGILKFTVNEEGHYLILIGILLLLIGIDLTFTETT